MLKIPIDIHIIHRYTQPVELCLDVDESISANELKRIIDEQYMLYADSNLARLAEAKSTWTYALTPE